MQLLIHEVSDELFRQGYDFAGYRFVQNGAMIAEVEMYPDIFSIYWESSIDKAKFTELASKLYDMVKSKSKVALPESVDLAMGNKKRMDEIHLVKLYDVGRQIEGREEVDFVRLYTPYFDAWSDVVSSGHNNALLSGLISDWALSDEITFFFKNSGKLAAEVDEEEFREHLTQLLLSKYKNIKE